MYGVNYTLRTSYPADEDSDRNPEWIGVWAGPTADLGKKNALHASRLARMQNPVTL